MPINTPCNCPNVNNNPVNTASFDTNVVGTGGRGAFVPSTNCVYFGVSTDASIIKFNLNDYTVTKIAITGLGANRVFDIVYNSINGLLYLGTNTQSIIKFNPANDTQGATINTGSPNANFTSSFMQFYAASNIIYFANGVDGSLTQPLKVNTLDCSNDAVNSFTFSTTGGVASHSINSFTLIGSKLYVTESYGGAGGTASIFDITIPSNSVALVQGYSILTRSFSKSVYVGSTNQLLIITNFNNTTSYGFSVVNVNDDSIAANITLGTSSGNSAGNVGYNAVNDFVYITQSDTQDNYIKFMKGANSTFGNSLVIGGNAITPANISFVSPQNSRYTVGFGGASQYINLFGTKQ